MYKYVCVVHVYVYIHIYMCIYIYIERERELIQLTIKKKLQKIDTRSEKTVSQRRHTEIVNRHTKICSMLLIY